jgi:hypothetical protein
MKKFVAAVSGVCLVGALAACSGEKPSSLPTLSESSSSGVTPTPTVTPSAVTPSAAKTPDSKGHEVFVGQSTATKADQKAVADVWVGFWRMRLNALFAAKVDPAAASEYVQGEALGNMVDYVGQLAKKKLHVQGDMMIGISSISISGSTATVDSCVNDWSIDVDAKGVAKGKPSLFFQSRGTLTKVAGGWRVSRAALISRLPCSA